MPAKSSKNRVRAPLSEERILRCAIRLADANGVESLSMRGLATKLGVEAMSLYNHVGGKDEILDGIVELVLGEIDVPVGMADWKAAMRRRAISAHEVLLRHPWAAGLLESRASTSPVRLKYADAVLGALRAGGFSIELSYHAFLTLDSYVYGFTLQEVSWPHDPNEMPRVVEDIQRQVRMEDYPSVSEVMGFVARRRAEGASSVRSAAYQSEFEFGLDLILGALERARDPSLR
jgi:AcrR family transcriptional regulator